MTTKRCPRCSATKPRADFSRCRSKKDGLQVYCKPCSNERSRPYKRDWIRRQRSVGRYGPSEEKREADRRYTAAHREQARCRAAAWAKANPERHARNRSRWAEENPEKWDACRRDAGARRRARKAGALLDDISIVEVYERDEGICGICWQPVTEDMSVDHVIPIVRGGMHQWANVQLAHGRCNSRKGARVGF